MSQEMLEQAAATPVTRRTVVKTGVKLAYAVPLVAATMKVSSHGAFAAVSGGGIQELDFCGHSVVGYDGGDHVDTWGCMQACKTTCPGGGNACAEACEICKTPPGNDNPCPSFGYCDAANFSCEGGAHYIG